jgi:hypothetical protein
MFLADVPLFGDRAFYESVLESAPTPTLTSTLPPTRPADPPAR